VLTQGLIEGGLLLPELGAVSKVQREVSGVAGCDMRTDFLLSHPAGDKGLYPLAGEHAAEKSGELPLHCLVSRNHSLKDEKKGFALLEHVLAMYPEAVSTTDGKGRYPLHLAVARNQPRIVMKLLKLFPDAAATADSDGRYPLHHCIAADNLDGEQTMHVATLLMDHDPQNTALMAADSEGMYPYFIAMGTRGKNGEDADSVASFLREKGSP